MNILLFGIIGIIGIIILIINTNKNSKFTNNNSLLVSKYWDNYRIGDVFFSPKSSKHYTDLSFYDNVLYHKDKYPGTIASEYIKRNIDSKDQDIQLLKKIIEEKKKQTKVAPIDDNELILHIRIGDVLCVNLDWGDIDHYSKKNDSVWWNNVIKYIKDNDISKVTILASSHKNKCINESIEYIDDRKNFLMKSGLKVNLRTGKSPDEDILYVTNAKHFISTGGNYGKLLNTIKK
jgi:hypothetical protein